MEAARRLTPVVLSQVDSAAPPLGQLEASRPFAFGAMDGVTDVALVAFDRALSDALESPSGVVVVNASPEAVESAALHMFRRASAVLGESFVTLASSATAESPWKQVARAVLAMAEGEASNKPVAGVRDVADAILGAPRGRCVVVADRAASAFGRGVIEVLTAADSPLPALVLVVSSTDAPTFRRSTDFASVGGFATFGLRDRLDASDVAAWWSAVARAEEEAPAEGALADLEYWWATSTMRRANAGSRAPLPEMSAAAERVLARLLLAARPCASDALATDAGAAISELRARGLVVEHQGSDSPSGRGDRRGGKLRAFFAAAPRTSVLREALEARATDEDRVAVVELLRALRGDADAAVRILELAPAPSRPEDDHRALAEMQRTVDAESREDLWRRFERAFELRWEEADAGPDTPTPWTSPDVEILNHATDVALAVGDSERAMAFAQRARRAVLLWMSRGGDSSDAEASLPSLEKPRRRADADVLLQLGRAEVAGGDLTSAALTIGRAIASANAADASDLALRGRVELAEVHYTVGRLDEARELAEACADPAFVAAAPEGATRGRPRPSLASVRLAARNVLGKVLLARSNFVEAEAHFAADASDAACLGDTMCELRARLNRAIALMSIARYAEARAMLEVVHRLGDERGELRAVSFALGNLATIAVLEHRYAEALALLERTIDLLRRVGDKPRLALFVTNLAELRLRLGLDREAEQLLLFGRRVCGISSPRLAQFALVSARIQLTKGRTVAAFRELNSALAPAGLALSAAGALSGSATRGWSGSAGGLVAEALRVAARAALEDGDADKASRLVDAAAKEPASARTDAELAILRALIARARGEDFGGLAVEAMDKAKTADDDELRVESNLVSFWATSELRFLDAARNLRNAIADALPEWLRSRYLQRPDLAVLEGEIERAAAETEAASRAAVLLRAEGRRESLPPASSGPISQPPSGVIKKRRFVGNDPSVRALLHAIKKIGPSDATVLIHGESGTGKELVADAIHEASNRASQPLVKVNCAALVETLLLSELFGHEKGAFTGAAARRKGRFEAAEGGTLFLDEIGDISHRTQVALLRVLQEKTFERVGGTSPIQADVRIVCASHKDLKQLVAAGQFREDLYYRLCGVALEVPSLRSRLDDLPEVADALLERIAKERSVPQKRLSTHARAALRLHTWPGNVRELENALRAASLFAEGDEIEVEDFALNVESLRFLQGASIPVSQPSSAGAGARLSSIPSEVGAAGGSTVAGPKSVATPSVQICTPPESSVPAPAPSTPTDVAYAHIRSGTSLFDLKKQIERECIARAMGETDGNITRAASLLGMKRPRLSQLVKQYGLGSGESADDADGLAASQSVDDDEV